MPVIFKQCNPNCPGATTIPSAHKCVKLGASKQDVEREIKRTGTQCHLHASLKLLSTAALKPYTVFCSERKGRDRKASNNRRAPISYQWEQNKTRKKPSSSLYAPHFEAAPEDTLPRLALTTAVETMAKKTEVRKLVASWKLN